MYKSIRYFLLVALGVVLLSGCGRMKHFPENPVATPNAANTCPQTAGVLGLRLEPGTYFTANPGAWKNGVSHSDMTRALMDTGCFSAVRHRRTISMRGHHIDYSLHKNWENTGPNLLTFPHFFLSGTLLPLIMHEEYNVELDYYFHGEKMETRRGVEEGRLLIGLIAALYPVWMNRDDYSRTESERLANVFVSVIAEEEPVQ
jgi:hypothetical protein